MSEAIREAIDDILKSCFETKQRNGVIAYGVGGIESTQKNYKQALQTLLALTNLKPDNRPSVVFKKVSGKYEECFIDNEDVFKGWRNLRPLEEKEVEKFLDSYKSHCEIMSGKKGLFACKGCKEEFAKSLISHFSKPQIVYPEKKHPEMSDTYNTRDLDREYGYDQAIDDMRKLNGGGNVLA